MVSLLCVQVLRRCQSPFVVGYFGAYHAMDGMHLATEWMDGGSLDAVLQRKGPFPQPVLCSVAASVGTTVARLVRAGHQDSYEALFRQFGHHAQVIQGLAYLNGHLRVMHRGAQRCPNAAHLLRSANKIQPASLAFWAI